MRTPTLTLPNGHTIGFDDLGQRDGEPLLFFHGTPASRTNLRFFPVDELLSRHPVRLISPDRPGIGWSSPQPQRTPRDWADDIRSLLDELGLDKATIVAHSGGGPYALACALYLADRLKAVGLVAGSPLDYRSRDGGSRGRTSRDGSSKDGGNADARTGVPGTNADSERFLELCANRPALARWLLRFMRIAALATPALFIRQASTLLPPADRRVMEDPRMQLTFLEMMREALRQGPAGAQQDGAIMYGPLRLPVEEIRIPVLLWYGSEDRNVPAHVGESYRAAIPTSELTLYPGEGHLSVMTRHGLEILEALLELSASR